jgi:hypothetical protein
VHYLLVASSLEVGGSDRGAAALASPQFVSHQYFAGAPAAVTNPTIYVGPGDVPFLFLAGSRTLKTKLR